MLAGVQYGTPNQYRDVSQPIVDVHEASRKMQVVNNLKDTMQYDLKIATRESKLLVAEKAITEERAAAALQHADARIEGLVKERDAAVVQVTRADKKRDWAEHRLQQEEEETMSMRRQVAQVLSDAGRERQEADAKLDALRAHVKSQDSQINNLRQTHFLQRGEWEKALKESGRLKREKEEELFKVHEEHSKVLQDKKNLEMDLRNEIHSHKEAIIGHLKDKEYLDSRLGQARDAHTAILKKHDLLVKELSQAKAEHKASVDTLSNQIMVNRIDFEKQIALAKQEHEATKSGLIRDHQTRTHMTIEDHQKRCLIYEDALAQAKAATQARIKELCNVTDAADKAAGEAAQRQASLELDVAEAKAQIGRLDLDLDQTRRKAQSDEQEQTQVRRMLEDALSDADNLTRSLREELDRVRVTMVEQCDTARREIAKLENDLEKLNGDFKALTFEKQMMEQRLTSRLEEQTTLKEREIWDHDQSKRRLESTAKELMVTSHERDELNRRLEAVIAEMERQEVALKAEHDRQMNLLNAEHRRRSESYEDALAKTRKLVEDEKALVGQTRALLQAQKDATARLQREFDTAALEHIEDKGELLDRLEKAEKARRREMVLKEKALTAEQEIHMQLLSARGELELSLKDTTRLRNERDEVSTLCQTTHEKKEMYKKRLFDAAESVETISTELEFTLYESQILRQEKMEAIANCELMSWEKEIVETSLQEEIEVVVEDKEEAEIQRDEFQRVLQKEMQFSSTLRKELAAALRENDELKHEIEDIDVGVTTASLRVNDLHSSQKTLSRRQLGAYGYESNLRTLALSQFSGSMLKLPSRG